MNRIFLHGGSTATVMTETPKHRLQRCPLASFPRIKIPRRYSKTQCAAVRTCHPRSNATRPLHCSTLCRACMIVSTRAYSTRELLPACPFSAGCHRSSETKFRRTEECTPSGRRRPTLRRTRRRGWRESPSFSRRTTSCPALQRHQHVSDSINYLQFLF